MFVFRCPTTGYNVQGRYEGATGPLPTFVGQHCLACNGLHVVDPLTGKGMSELRAVATRRQSSGPTSLQIPTQAGHLFRFDRGHPSDLKPATIPI